MASVALVLASVPPSKCSHRHSDSILMAVPFILLNKSDLAPTGMKFQASYFMDRGRGNMVTH